LYNAYILKKEVIATKRAVISLIILLILYLWAELGVGIFFQDSWGGD